MKTRYAICGLSVRGINHFLLPLLGRAEGPGANDFSADSEVVGIFDIDRERVEAFNRQLRLDIPFYPAADGLAAFLDHARPDVLLVAGPDFTHADAIVAGLERGLRVIAEKPVVISSAEMQRVFAAEADSSGSLTVAHNARYNAQLGIIRDVIRGGELGRLTNIEYMYNLDTFHGPSYFYRWNRQRTLSGGLSIHKGVHHFDVLHWLIGSPPERVFGFGALNYFGPRGEHNPQHQAGQPLTHAETRTACPYFQKHYAAKRRPDEGRLTPGWDTLRLPYPAQYPGDAYLYDSEIAIEDTYSAVLQYRNGVSVSYSCNFSTPIEGYTLAINGTKARLEASRIIDPTGQSSGDQSSPVRVIPLFGPPRTHEVPPLSGGHGGADPLIQQDLFHGPSEESLRLGRPASSYDGALAVACGEALWRSIQDVRPYTIQELLGPWHRTGQ